MEYKFNEDNTIEQIKRYVIFTDLASKLAKNFCPVRRGQVAYKIEC